MLLTPREVPEHIAVIGGKADQGFVQNSRSFKLVDVDSHPLVYPFDEATIVQAPLPRRTRRCSPDRFLRIAPLLAPDSQRRPELPRLQRLCDAAAHEEGRVGRGKVDLEEERYSAFCSLVVRVACCRGGLLAGPPP